MDLAVALVVHVLHGSPVDILIVLAHHAVDPNDLGIRVLLPHIIKQCLGIGKRCFGRFVRDPLVICSEVDDDDVVFVLCPIPVRSTFTTVEFVYKSVYLTDRSGLICHNAQLGIQITGRHRRIGIVAVAGFDLIRRSGRIAVLAVQTVTGSDRIANRQNAQLTVFRLRHLQSAGKLDMADRKRTENRRISRQHTHSVLALGKSAH